MSYQPIGENWSSYQLAQRRCVAVVARLMCSMVVCSAALTLVACSGGDPKSGELVVLTRSSPTTFYLDHNGDPVGPDVDLLSDFAAHQGLSIRFKPVSDIEQLFTSLEMGEGHIAAAGLSGLPARFDRFRASDPYQEVNEVVVCRRGGPNPDRLEELDGVSITVAAGTVFEERMTELEHRSGNLQWKSEPFDVRTLLEQVWRREESCTMADSNVALVNRRYYPELTIPLQLPVRGAYSWYLPPRSGVLEQQVNNWLREYRRSGELARTLDRHYGKIFEYDYVDTRRFLRRVKARLPRYQPVFENAASEYDFHWTTLAAMAYQESHWRADARSPTGVRGMMMLTLPTAQELGVESRLDPVQSIEGGALYLSRLRERLPEHIQEPDRTWFAMAAYNVGYGHLKDAMVIAEQQGRRSDLWHEIQEVLPLLEQKAFYRRTKYGYARGTEPVNYVTRIRNYADMLRERLRREQLELAKIAYKS